MRTLCPPLNHIDPSEGDLSGLLVWFISAVTGLVTLAVEGISGYLQSKRNKAMANAMDALHRAQVENYDSLQQYKDDLLLYGSYSLNSTTDILNTLEGMYVNQASISTP